MRQRLPAFASLALVVAALAATPARAVENPAQKGTVTGLQVPRYVSLRSDNVNMRQGPTRDHETTWLYRQAGLPVEITAEFETWRKVRDSEGSEGWVFHSLLSGRRTALVAPWKKDGPLDMLGAAANPGDVVARLEPNVIVNVKKCDGQWCRIEAKGVSGYVEQKTLWGVYPDERIE